MSEGGFPWRTLLFVSVAFNLVVISAAVGALASGARLERPGAEAGVNLPGPRAFMQSLPLDAKRVVRRQFAQAMLASRAQREESRAARLAVFETARTEPYNAARVSAAFARVRTADAAVAAAFQDTVAQGLAQLTPEQRRTALDALARQTRGGRLSALRNPEN